MTPVKANRSLTTSIELEPLTPLLLNLMNWTIFWYRPETSLSGDEIADRMVTLFLDGGAADRRRPDSHPSALIQRRA